MALPVPVDALPARGLVEAERGRGREVEALGPPVDRDRDAVVGQGGELVGQPPRLVAEQPGGRAGQRGVVQPDLAGAVRGEDGEPGVLRRARPRPRRTARPRAAGGRASRRWPARSWGCRRRPSCRRAPRRPRPPRRRSGSRCRRCPGRGRRRRSRPAGRRPPPRRPGRRRTGTGPPRPAGVTESESEARARSSTQRDANAVGQCRELDVGAGEDLVDAAGTRARPRRPSGRRQGTAAARSVPSGG